MGQIQSNDLGVATLYYDGRCPLCSAEMARLNRLKNGQLRLQDIHTLTAEGGEPDRETLLRTLHLRQAGGRWLTGADANVAAWQFTRRGVWFRWLRWPLLRGLVDILYDAWARRRYHRLYARSCAVQESR